MKIAVGIAFGSPEVKIKVTVTKNRKMVSITRVRNEIL
jgi:hypothetical protein